ncbi:MAG: glycosyltransferase, partial [Alphaproteobacteria bacterium]|nr:glycosyltransferase [Alphaproteobacteria bacterium]
MVSANEQTKISIIMPVYNTPENFLRPAIESVLNQTFKDFELIIVNDGSTKNNVSNVVKSYSDNRIKYIDNKHVGAACARNIGLDNAGGDFILIMDSDDVVDTNLYATLIKLADSYNPDIVIFNIYGDKDDGTIEQYENVIPFKITNSGNTTKMVRRKLINDNYIRFQDLSTCNGVCFAYTCLAYATK